MTIDLIPHVGVGLLSHDSDGHARTLLDVISRTGLADAAKPLTHPSGPFGGLISPTQAPFPGFAAQWAGGDRSAWDRGTPGHIRRTIQHLLAGSKRVDLTEETGGYDATATVYQAEVSDALTVQRAVDQVAPAGIKITVNVRPGWSFADLAASGLSFADLARLSGGQARAIVPGTPRNKIEEMMVDA